MRVIRKDPGERPCLVEIPNTLDALQNAVGGYIETVTLFSNATIICNEEGILRGLQYNCRLCKINFVGTILVVGIKEDKMCSLGDKEAERIMRVLRWA